MYLLHHLPLIKIYEPKVSTEKHHIRPINHLVYGTTVSYPGPDNITYMFSITQCAIFYAQNYPENPLDSRG